MIVLHEPISYGSRSNSPDLVVVHAMAEHITGYGSAREALDKMGLSAHALVTPDGKIIRCRSDAQGAYHAKGYNNNSLGIEFLVPGEHSYSTFLRAMTMPWVEPEQYKAGLEQIQAWVAYFGIHKGKVVRHSVLDPDRKSDPGLGFPWKKLLSEVF